MWQKERLVELLAQYDEWQLGTHSEVDFYYEHIADYLLSNGVIVPPCKVGDRVYYREPKLADYFQRNVILDFLDGQKPTITEASVIAIASDGLDFIYYVNNNDGQRWVDAYKCYFTREEAEQALKEREQ